MAVLLLTPRAAPGQSTGGYYYETYRYGYNPGYYARRYSTLPRATATTGKNVTDSWVYRYYVPAPAASPSGGSRPYRVVISLAAVEEPVPTTASAQIELEVPDEAEVYFDGEKTKQTGRLRRFLTPPLSAGGRYTYEVRVVWKEGEGERTETRRLSFGAGESVSASFRAAGTTAGLEGPKRPALVPEAEK
jgi:uncharacterized protein (TIGR03000 family)